jgi:hypothetical protein
MGTRVSKFIKSLRIICRFDCLLETAPRSVYCQLAATADRRQRNKDYAEEERNNFYCQPFFSLMAIKVFVLSLVKVHDSSANKVSKRFDKNLRRFSAPRYILWPRENFHVQLQANFANCFSTSSIKYNTI